VDETGSELEAVGKLVQGSMFKVRASRILSFEGSITNTRKILHFVQDRPGTLEHWNIELFN
jgi:hypothetical protein